MHLHSTLDGRLGRFRVRGAAWETIEPARYRGFLYLISVRERDGRYLVVEAEGETMWKLLDALGAQASALSGAPVARLDAHRVGAERAARSRDRRKSAAAA